MGRDLEYEDLGDGAAGPWVELVRRACLQAGGAHLRLYAVGGDGTLNEIARGALGMWNVAIGHFPVGTGNDFIKTFGDRAPLFQKLGNLVEGEEIPVIFGGQLRRRPERAQRGVDARVAAGMRKYKRLPLMHGQWPYAALHGGKHHPRAGGDIPGHAGRGKNTTVLTP